jgi:hypothetical protein
VSGHLILENRRQMVHYLHSLNAFFNDRFIGDAADNDFAPISKFFGFQSFFIIQGCHLMPFFNEPPGFPGKARPPVTKIRMDPSSLLLNGFIRK